MQKLYNLGCKTVCTAAAGDWQNNISDLEGKVTMQAKEIQAHIEAIAILENQKLDLIQGNVTYELVFWELPAQAFSYFYHIY
jgi:hypothetical protein